MLGKLSDQQRSLLEERFKAAERQAAGQGLDIGYRRLERANGGGNGYSQDGGYPQDNGYAADPGCAACCRDRLQCGHGNVELQRPCATDVEMQCKTRVMGTGERYRHFV